MECRGLRRRVTLGAALGLAVSAVAAQSTVPGALRSAATQQSIGVEWDIAGDGDHDAQASLRYRVQGASAWKTALPLVRVQYNGANQLAGSVLFLTPATAYELELSLADPDGGAALRTLVVATRTLPQLPTGGRMLHVAPGASGGDGSAANPYRGLQTAWAVAQPGDTLLLHGGNYGGVRDTSAQSGAPGNPIVIKAYGDGDPVLDFLELFRRSHLWFEGLRFQFNGSSDTAFYACLTNPGYDTGFQAMLADVNGIVLTRNRFEGYKHAIRAGPRTSGWVISDNAITGDKPLGLEDEPSYDGEGVELAHGSDHVVAYNSITHVADGVSFPERNCDIHGNDIFDVTDDGIELDHGEANIRVWGNRIHNAGHNGIAFQPQDGAPWYIVRNQLVNMQESVFKFRDTDRFVIAHNTFVNWGWVVDHWSDHLLRGMTRNNLWISVNNGPIWNRGSAAADWRTDLDYDGFDWGSNSGPFSYQNVRYADLPALRAVSGQQVHGIRINRGTCFETFNVPGPPPLTTIPPQWMTLRSTCAAVDAGVVLPNLSDGFGGSAPDLGAYELGTALPHYGVRPVTSGGPLPPTNLRAY